MGDLQGRVALVTGAGRGIGAASARALAAAGARVICSDLAAPEALAAELGGLALAQDVTDEGDWEAAMAFARQQAGGLDILVNNAGVFLMKPLTETSLADWRRVHTVNVEGVFLGCQVFGKYLVERGQGGSIINLGSMSGIVPLSRVITYSASKGAVHNLSLNLAREWATARVRVNVLVPGFFPAEQNRRMLLREDGTYTDRGRAIIGHTPMGRFGEAKELAGAVVWLASPRASSFVTGQNIVVDGGFSSVTI